MNATFTTQFKEFLYAVRQKSMHILCNIVIYHLPLGNHLSVDKWKSLRFAYPYFNLVNRLMTAGLNWDNIFWKMWYWNCSLIALTADQSIFSPKLKAEMLLKNISPFALAHPFKWHPFISLCPFPFPPKGHWIIPYWAWLWFFVIISVLCIQLCTFTTHHYIIPILSVICVLYIPKKTLITPLGRVLASQFSSFDSVFVCL